VDAVFPEDFSIKSYTSVRRKSQWTHRYRAVFCTIYFIIPEYDFYTARSCYSTEILSSPEYRVMPAKTCKTRVIFTGPRTIEPFRGQYTYGVYYYEKLLKIAYYTLTRC